MRVHRLDVRLQVCVRIALGLGGDAGAVCVVRIHVGARVLAQLQVQVSAPS